MSAGCVLPSLGCGSMVVGFLICLGLLYTGPDPRPDGAERAARIYGGIPILVGTVLFILALVLRLRRRLPPELDDAFYEPADIEPTSEKR